MAHEQEVIMYEAHEVNVEGQNEGKEMERKVLCIGLWWPSLFQCAKDYFKKCDVC